MKSRNNKIPHVAILILLALLSAMPVAAQKRGSKRAAKSPIPPATGAKIASRPASRPRRTQPIKPPQLPLIPKYTYDEHSGLSRVILDWSPVEEQTGANNVRFYIRYVYAKDWMQIAALNEVAFGFAVNSPQRVCPDECQYTLIIDDYEQPVRATSQATKMGDGSINETILKWMPPKVFKQLAEAKRLQVKVGAVTFRLSDRQIEGMRGVVPFLRFRPFFN
jgi:hypothetical protein